MKNVKKVATLLLIMIVAIGSYFVAKTYAKYTSEIAGTASSATVAKWAWTIGSDDITSAADVTNGYTFDLFDTIKDSDLTSTETDVDTGLIAPGTSGSFDIELTNNSEVNAEYAIDFTVTNANSVPIEFSTDGSTWVTSLADVSATRIDMGETDTATVYWRWAFTGAESTNFTSSQTDTTDTALGFAANTSAATVTVDATVTVTQID